MQNTPPISPRDGCSNNEGKAVNKKAVLLENAIKLNFGPI